MYLIVIGGTKYSPVLDYIIGVLVFSYECYLRVVYLGSVVA
jgi:hypothetical protein